FTPLGGKIPRRYVTASIFLLQALALVALVTLHSTLAVVIFVILFGTGFGAITPARASLVAELYGRKEYGTISGTMMLFVTGARSLAPVSAGILYTAFGRYEPVFWILVAISLLAVGAVLLIETGLNTVGLPEGRLAQTS
ncbi:MAG: MFS transporter, partial [Acetobacteraceae bacterium]